MVSKEHWLACPMLSALRVVCYPCVLLSYFSCLTCAPMFRAWEDSGRIMECQRAALESVEGGRCRGDGASTTKGLPPQAVPLTSINPGPLEYRLLTPQSFHTSVLLKSYPLLLHTSIGTSLTISECLTRSMW